MVVGPVGSGKTTLLQALLGELHSLGKQPVVAGRIAYTAQDSFITNQTLRTCLSAFLRVIPIPPCVSCMHESA